MRLSSIVKVLARRGGKKWGTKEHVPGDIFSLFTQREIAGTCSSKFLILASFLGNMFPLIIHYKPNFHLFGRISHVDRSSEGANFYCAGDILAAIFTVPETH